MHKGTPLVCVSNIGGSRYLLIAMSRREDRANGVVTGHCWIPHIPKCLRHLRRLYYRAILIFRAGSRNSIIIEPREAIYANAKTSLPDTSSRQQRLRDGRDSAPDLATSYLRSYAQYKILFKTRVRPGCCTKCCTVNWSL